MEGMSEVFARVDRFVEAKMALDGIPGLSLAITDATADVHVRTFGVSSLESRETVRDDTLFQIGSISKFFTCIALLQQQETGAVDVRNPVTDYLPWFEVSPKHAPITLHHLMTHTGGIPCGADSTVAPESEVWALRCLEGCVPPGKRFHYSNTGYKALGLVLEAVTGRPYADVIRDGILRPLGMGETEPVITNAIRARSAVGYTWLEDDRPPARNGPLATATWFESNTGDGSISSTPGDMAKYVRMILNRGKGPEGRLVSERGFELLTAPHVGCGEDDEEERYGYGIGVEQSGGRAILSHTGGMVGYTSSMLADMGLGLGIIVLTNSVDEPREVSDYFLRLLDAVSADNALPDAQPPVQRHVPSNPGEYAGEYSGRSGKVLVRERGGGLVLEVDGTDATMECVKQDYFRVDDPRFRLFLVRFMRSSGRVVGAVFGGDEYSLASGTVPSPSDQVEPAEQARYAGHYRSHNPWLGNFRVVSRGGSLVFVEPSGMEQAMNPMGDASFRLGDDPLSPETLRFGMVVDGRTMMADLSGGLYHRVFTP